MIWKFDKLEEYEELVHAFSLKGLNFRRNLNLEELEKDFVSFRNYMCIYACRMRCAGTDRD